MNTTVTFTCTLNDSAEDQEKLRRLLEIITTAPVSTETAVVADEIAEPLDDDDARLGNSPFTQGQMREFWSWVRDKRAGVVVARVASTEGRGVRKDDLVADIGKGDGPTFGGYLSSLGHAVSGLKLPANPLMKADIHGELWYLIDPDVSRFLWSLAQKEDLPAIISAHASGLAK